MAMIEKSEILVKICGTRTVEAAQCAIESGADLIGMILVPNVKRTVSLAQAKAISDVVHQYRDSQEKLTIENDHPDWFEAHAKGLRKRAPQIVGVFKNQPLEDVLRLQAELDLDLVQLHGSEPLEWAKEIPVPVIKKFDPVQVELYTSGYHSVILLDGAGGEGQKISWTDLPSTVPFILAGGLTVDNVSDAVALPHVRGVDVSSGIETNGKQDIEKIRQFIIKAKTFRLHQ
ncbi:isomerase-domain-containing protein [Dipodascopsis uninucleata]